MKEIAVTTTPEPTTNTATPGILDFFDLKLLWKRKWSVLFCTALSAGLGAAYITQEKPIFEVTSRILVQMERFSTEKETLLRSDSYFLVTQGEILSSPMNVQKALQSINKTPDNPPDYAAADVVIRGLRVSTVDNANVLRLSYRSGDPQHGIALLSAIVDSYRAYIKEVHHGQYGQSLEALTQHEEELRAQLRALEDDYYQFRQNSPVVGQGDEVTRTNYILLEQLAMRLTNARVMRIDKETQLQTLVKARDAHPNDQQLTASQIFPTSLITPDAGEEAALAIPVETFKADERFSGGAYSDPVRIEEQLWQAETRLKEISQTYGELHPDRKAVMAEIEMLQTRLNDCTEAEPLRLQLQLAALKQTENYLMAEHAAEYEKVKALNIGLLQEQQKQAEIDRVRSVYQSIAEQLRNLKLANEAPMNGPASITVRTLEPPDATAKMVWPRPLPFIAICSVFGLALGCVVVTVASRATGR